MSTTRRSGSFFDPNGKIVKDARQKYSENWLDEAEAECPIRQEYQVSVNGSGKNSRYLASLSYLNEEGTLKTTGFERYTVRRRGFSPKKWLDFGANVNYAHTDSQFLGSEGTANNTNVWQLAMLMAPIYPVYKKNPDGSTVYRRAGRSSTHGSSRPAGAQNNRNSVATLFDDDYYTLTDNVSTRAYVGFNWKGLKFTLNIGVDNVNAYETTNYNPLSGNAVGTGHSPKEKQPHDELYVEPAVVLQDADRTA